MSWGLQTSFLFMPVTFSGSQMCSGGLLSAVLPRCPQPGQPQLSPATAWKPPGMIPHCAVTCPKAALLSEVRRCLYNSHATEFRPGKGTAFIPVNSYPTGASKAGSMDTDVTGPSLIQATPTPSPARPERSSSSTCTCLSC